MKVTEWEACLTRHYLRSDGPFGDGPISFIDATPAELRLASGRDDWSEEAARQSFLDSFNATETRMWLDGRARPTRLDEATPGYFRYLVLSCFVVATDSESSNTHDFRLRLADVLGTDAAFQSVSGVNKLWQSLEQWCERRRNAGEHIRRIVLPDPGNMRLIGHAVKLAFPAWKDRAAFARVLAEIPNTLRHNPLRLTDELIRPHRWWSIPPAIQEVCRDFAARLARHDRMLLTHRFWGLVTSINESLIDKACVRLKNWILEASFGGYEGDELQLRLCVNVAARRQRPNGEGHWSDIEFAELLTGKMKAVPTSLLSAVQVGAIPLTEREGGSWTFDGHFPSPDDSVVLLASAELHEQLQDIGQPWISLGSGWLGSARLSKSEINTVRTRLHGVLDDDDYLVAFEIKGGVRTGRSTYLGRPKFLPRLLASDSAEIGMETSGEVDGILIAVGNSPRWALSSKAPITGRWRLTATEGGLDHEIVITLEADAPEREFDQSDQPDKRFEPEPEVRMNDSRLIVTSGRLSRTSAPKHTTTDLDDLLEAVCTASPQGWSEAQLIPLVQAVLPDPRMVWDMLRSLAEAGWIEPYVSLSWRARRWRLRGPRLIQIASHCVLVDGAVGARSRRKLTSAASACGGEVEIRDGISQFAPSTIIVHGVSCSSLAAECGWPSSPATRPELRSAPDCWITDLRTIQGRSLAGIWSFELGLFQPAPSTIGLFDGIAIERWRRERGDDRDVFRICGAGPDIFLTSRTAALLEGYRRARRCLFRWSDGQLWRSAGAGYLPLPVARALRCKSLTSAGPVPLQGKAASYAYAAELADAQWLASIFGSTIEVPNAPETVPWMRPSIKARRMGLRAAPAELFGPTIDTPAYRDRT